MSILRGRFLAVLSLLSIALLVPLAPTPAPVAAAEDAPKAKLAVLVVFDQLRGDYLTRWDDQFGADGFHRLEKDGAWFQNCHYPYANTITGAGHASLATGCSPNRHGIVHNDWYDREAREPVYCATSPRYQQVPAAKKSEADEKQAQMKDPGSGSPERLLAPTLGDALKAATDGKGKVVALSLKDRSSCLPGGKKPDACYWFDATTGNMVTSTYYRDAVHPWVAEFNKERLAESWYRKDWTRFRPDLDYEKLTGPDDVVGEGKGYGQGRTFPHPMDGGKKELGKDYYEALCNSPFGNDLLLELAKRAIDAEKLGQHDTPDLLTLSFSSNDLIGHNWGPDSHEVLDVTLRSDLIVKELLDYLDAKVGKGKYVLILSADHGVCPLPEVAKAQGKDAGRIDLAAFLKAANAFLREKYEEPDEKTRCIEALTDTMIYLNRAWLKEKHLDQSEVENTLAAWLPKQPGIQTAYTRTQLLGDLPAEDAIGRSVQKSYYEKRSGDVLMVTKPYYFVWKYAFGTTHGSPHSYDTHVPLLAMGPGIHGGIRKDAVTPQAGVMILSRALGIKPPAGADAKLPEKLFADGE
jgi:predicted AlkP superfamily pyrophosphatase or phosphodiesterase